MHDNTVYLTTWPKLDNQLNSQKYTFQKQGFFNFCRIKALRTTVDSRIILLNFKTYTFQKISPKQKSTLTTADFCNGRMLFS